MISLLYLAHSSFLVTCGKTQLLFDPWLRDGAYSNQWFLWPLSPLKPSQINADAIIISHGHEDHLHIETLQELSKSSKIFFPFQWRAGIKPFLNQLGFRNVIESVSFHTYKVNDVSITYIGYSLESVIVIEYNNEVLVNINDALNSNHETAVEFILKEISKRYPKIDYLLSGWSGAGYFPNQVRFPGKNDKHIAMLREQYFANNFFRFTHHLHPKSAIPFAPGFLLPDNENHWINHIKFPRKHAQQYYDRNYKSEIPTNFIISYPGDIIENGMLTRKSGFHELPEKDHYVDAYSHYRFEIEAVNTQVFVDESQINELVEMLYYWINFNKQLYHPKTYNDIIFSILLSDVIEPCYLNISYSENKFQISRCTEPLQDKKVLITTKTRKLIETLKREWGGDILTIGYGLTVDVYDVDSLEKNLDIVCIRLITRYPIARKDIRKFPFRAIKYYLNNPAISSLWLTQKIKLKPYVNKFPFNERDHWLTYNQCDLCAVCKMPEIDLEKYYQKP